MLGLQHEEMEQAVTAVEEAMESAKDDGKWMVAVWSVGEDRVYLRTRTTWSFPSGDVAIAMRLLRDSLRDDEPAPEPLPAAKFIDMAIKGTSEEEKNE